MKIAMPKDGEILNQHFGKSKSFAIVTLDENKVIDIKEVSAETLQHNHQGLADLLVSEEVSLIITGGIGEGAYTPMIEKGIKVIRGASGTIEEILKNYIEGNLKDKAVMCTHHHEH